MHHLCRRYCANQSLEDTYAELTDEQRTAFQAILDNPEGDPEEAFIHSGLIRTRKDAEACMNHLWPKRDSYPLMFALIDDILALFERRRKG